MTEWQMITSNDSELITLGVELFRQEYNTEECKAMLNNLYEMYIESDDREKDHSLSIAIYKLSNLLPEGDPDFYNFKESVDPYHRIEKELEEQEELF